MALNDIYELIDFQRLPSGEGIQNVYFYERMDTDGTAGDLIDAWIDEVRTPVRAIQATNLVHYLTRARSLGDVAQFSEETPAGIVGTMSGVVRTEWDCFNFTLRPSTRAVRPGSKRIGGIIEADALYTNGVVTDAAFLTLLHAAKTSMGVTLTGALSTWRPIILKRVLDGTTYRLPETEGELVAVPVASVLMNPKITHQISRGNAR